MVTIVLPGFFDNKSRLKLAFAVVFRANKNLRWININVYNFDILKNN